MKTIICKLTTALAVCFMAVSAWADEADEQLIKQLQKKFEETILQPVLIENGSLMMDISIDLNNGKTVKERIMVLPKVEEFLGRRGYTFLTIAFQGRSDLIDRDIALVALNKDPIFGGEGSVVKFANTVSLMRYVPINVTANQLLNVSVALVAHNARLKEHLAKAHHGLEDES